MNEGREEVSQKALDYIHKDPLNFAKDVTATIVDQCRKSQASGSKTPPKALNKRNDRYVW